MYVPGPTYHGIGGERDDGSVCAHLSPDLPRGLPSFK